MTAEKRPEKQNAGGQKIAVSLEVGSIVEGVITGITSYGAFVELPSGKTGLVHISEVADSYVEDVRQFMKERDRVQVKILGVNEKGKYDLSVKQAVKPGAPAQPRRSEKKVKVHPNPGVDMTFEEKLTKFLKESEERQLDIKRNIEAKRGRGRAR